MNGSLKTGNKYLFAEVLTSNVDCQQSSNGYSALIIDSRVLVNSLRIPWNNLANSEHLVNESETKTFGASEKHFAKIVFIKGQTI